MSSDRSAGERRRAPLHRALIYEDIDELVAAAGAFAREGLAAGERVVIVAPSPKLGPLREALGRDADEVEIADAGGFYQRLGTMFTSLLRLLDATARPGTGRLRLLAEQPLGSLPARHARAYQRYEAVSNVAYAPYDTYVLCPYDASVLRPELIEGARRTHPELVERGRVRRSPTFTDPAAFIRQSERRRPLPPPPGPGLEVTAPEGLAGARRFLEERTAGAGAPPDAVADLLLAAHEIALNALQHGGGNVRIHAWIATGAIHCQLADAGGGLREPFAGYLPPAPDAASGRGLWLAHQLCDLVQVSAAPDDGTTVRLEVDL